MMEKYPLLHYDFTSTGDGRPSESTVPSRAYQSEADTLVPIQNTTYRLRGSVDILPFFPQPDDWFSSHMHLQAFSHMQSAEDYYTERSMTESYLLLYTESGAGSFTYEGKTYLLKKDDLIWIDCRRPHSYHTEGDHWYHTDLHVDGTGIHPLYKEFSGRTDLVLHREDLSFFREDLEVLLDAYVGQDPKRNLRVAHGIETLLVHLILEADEHKKDPSAGSEALQKAVRHLHEHYREPITIDQLAESSGYSKYHLSREFKKLTGFSPNEYLIRLRLEQAKMLLAHTALPANKIAALAGIPNEVYFSRLFRAREGMTPGEFRRRMTSS